ncbi:MAG: alpha,alpha-trehalase [Ignavibacteriae bacterium]|nr:alpha,alpha-trehalase [Ignavibacteriota bacterium]
MQIHIIYILIALLSFVSIVFCQDTAGVYVDPRSTLKALLENEDTDNDTKITIDDPHIAGTDRGDKRFWIRAQTGAGHEVSGTYYISNLLQELKLAEEAGNMSVALNPARIFEPPAERVSRMIREVYWDGLTRRIDEQGLTTILADEKTTTVDGYNYIYVPPSDKLAYDYFSGIARKKPDSKIKVVQLPQNISGDYVRKLDGRHGILLLALKRDAKGKIEGVPFVVPGGRFNEMYGWDSYFIVLGLLQDNRIELAQGMVDNFVYEITHYGKILNANRTYFLTRSQPPFLTSMALAVYERLPKSETSKEWLRNAIEAAIKEYNTVWIGTARLMETGLSRYYDEGYGAPPEVEPGHFDDVYERYAKKFNMTAKAFENAYRSGSLKVPELDEYFIHDRAMRESGHDTSYRLVDRCANLVTVDLNSLLYKIETDIAGTLDKEFSSILKFPDGTVETSDVWKKRAARRKELMNKYLWNNERGMYFDYDFTARKQTDYVSATTFYPLWAGAADARQAELLVKNTLPLLEMPGGIVSSTETSRGQISDDRPARQWDYPNAWAPHQMLVWQGMLNYGYDTIAHRLAYCWLHMFASNAANYSGTIPEKFDVVARSHQVFAEYGNVGTKFSYITREGFGWTNASFQVGLNLLPDSLRAQLNRLIPPEWLD